MSDTQAFIEEARGYVHPDSAHALYLIGCLADALESSEAELARLRSVVAGVEALAEQHERFAAAQEAGPPVMANLAKTNRAFARRLRSVLSDTRKDSQ